MIFYFNFSGIQGRYILRAVTYLIPLREFEPRNSQGASLTSEESDLAYRSEDLEERVDTESIMAATEGDLFCDKQMTPNKNLRAANPKKRGDPEKSSKSKHSGDGAMTLKVEGSNHLE